jgi:DNA-binding transcriptional MerR regulator
VRDFSFGRKTRQNWGIDLERALTCRLKIMNTVDEKLTIQQVAEATGLSVHTLRYYERVGLIHQIGRAENTHRRYTADDIGWIDFLNKLRSMGMSIQEMQLYLELQRQGDLTLPQRLEMLKALRHNVETHIDELHEHLKVICYKIDLYQEIVDQQSPDVC